MEIKSGKRDSDPRPLAWEANALPTELFPLVLAKIISLANNCNKLSGDHICKYWFRCAIYRLKGIIGKLTAAEFQSALYLCEQLRPV